MAEFYKIGEVSKMCNISIKTLRYYEEFGLITPVEVDIYTGYRHYDSKNVETIYKIQFLKDLGFSLKEIKDFDETQINEKIREINEKIEKLKNSVKLMDSLNKHKGEENIMKPFINDKDAIGKWKYVCSAVDKEAYEKGDTFEDNDVLMKELYFLPNGEGYWIFDRWTKGTIYHFGGRVYNYTIKNDTLLVDMTNDHNEHLYTLIFTKSDCKEYTENEIRKDDDTSLPFVLDKEAVGSWQVVDLINIDEKFNYEPKETNRELFLKSLTLLENGDCFKEFNNNKITKIKWTKDFILDTSWKVAPNFIVKDINNETYLIMDWKSGDYQYGNLIQCCYVLKKVK